MLKRLTETVDRSRWGKPVYLAHHDRIVKVTTIEQARHQLNNGWPSTGLVELEHVIACNAVELASRGVFDAAKARRLFVNAACVAGLI
jgi:Protein of unknown function (DUF982)